MATRSPHRAPAKAITTRTARAVEIRSLEDLLAAPTSLPDEAADEIAQLRGAILADLAPQTAYERILAANLVELECEQRRLRRWIVTAIRAEVVRRALADLRQRSSMPRQQRSRIEADLMAVAPERQAAGLAACRNAGLDLEALVARVRLALDAEIARLEADLRDTERRRRALFEDLDRLRRRARLAAIPEAETMPVAGTSASAVPEAQILRPSDPGG